MIKMPTSSPITRVQRVAIPDCVFTLRADEWNVVVDGKVVAATWNSRGAALAGLIVEQKRIARNTDRLLTNTKKDSQQ